MGNLADEVRLWNTPIVGAYLLWRFTSGYTDHHTYGDPPGALLHFLAIGILTSPPLLETISRKRPNLQSYARGLQEKGRTDLLFGIQERVRTKREYTLASIDVAVANGLLVWDPEQGTLHARPLDRKPSVGCRPKGSMEKGGQRAEVLGMWFSEHDIIAIGTYLGVAF